MVEENQQPGPPGPPPEYSGGYESFLNKNILRADSERTFIDKILGRQDSEILRSLMKKEKLTREDISELLYLLSSINSKLSNFNDWDRYLLGKFFVWIREFATLLEEIHDYGKDLHDPETGMIRLMADEKPEIIAQLSDILFKVENINSHNLKFLVDVFLYLSNSTLSLRATAFDTLTKSKFEYWYPNAPTQEASIPNKGGFNFFMKR